MKSFWRYILLFSALSSIHFCANKVIGNPPLKKDSSAVDLRKFESAKIDQYRELKEFKYDLQKPEEMGIWDRFWSWVWRQYYKLMQNQGFRVGFKIFLWVLAIGVILYAILKIVGMEKIAFLVRGRKDGDLAYEVEQENIYAINFNTAIEEAIRTRDFRLAIRLMYLKCLRQLADRNLINWQVNKTNDDYARELSSTAQSQGFSSITLIFEYTWYGGFEISEQLFSKAQQEYQQFNQQLAQ